MQSAPRLARTAVRQAARTPTTVSTSTSSPFVTTHLYSLHSTQAQPVSLRFPTSHVRGLSSTARVEAKEPEQDPFASEKFASEHAPLFQRIQQHPEVLDAIENMARVTRDKTGVDLAAPETVHDDDAPACTVRLLRERYGRNRDLLTGCHIP
jgi:hypothetical protein